MTNEKLREVEGRLDARLHKGIEVGNCCNDCGYPNEEPMEHANWCILGDSYALLAEVRAKEEQIKKVIKERQNISKRRYRLSAKLRRKIKQLEAEVKRLKEKAMYWESMFQQKRDKG